MRVHATTIIADTAGAPGAIAACSAVRPCAGVIRLQPDACSRAFTAPPAAMPTSPHGPHCTLAAACAHRRRSVASASSTLFAAL